MICLVYVTFLVSETSLVVSYTFQVSEIFLVSYIFLAFPISSCIFQVTWFLAGPDILCPCGSLGGSLWVNSLLR